jgi:hypothetical protein
MSQGAVFKIVLQDDRFDNLLTASQLLKSRLVGLGRTGQAPSITDISKTHILYMYNTYQPHVAIASEYTKVKPFGDGVSFIGASRSAIEFTFPSYGNFTSDMFIHLKIKAIGNESATVSSASNPLLRYCAYPGVRILKKVELRSAQTLIDEYTPDDVMSNSKFFVTENQKSGWDRCMGQQMLKEANYVSNNYTGSIMYRDGVTNIQSIPRIFRNVYSVTILVL